MKELYEAIKTHCDIEDEIIIEAGNHGAQNGFCGFTYYQDTVKFYDDNEELIIEHLESTADYMGYDSYFAWVSSLLACKKVANIVQFKNLCSWIILEEVGHWLEERTET